MTKIDTICCLISRERVRKCFFCLSSSTCAQWGCPQVWILESEDTWGTLNPYRILESRTPGPAHISHEYEYKINLMLVTLTFSLPSLSSFILFLFLWFLRQGLTMWPWMPYPWSSASQCWDYRYKSPCLPQNSLYFIQ
jgi:hypothetical protein